VQQFGFDFVLETTGAGGAHRLHVGGGGDVARAAHEGDFVRVLDEPHFVEHGGDFVDAARRALAVAHVGARMQQGGEDAPVPRRVGGEARP